MKKKLLLILLCIIPIYVNAECSYSEKYELNALSSYIDYTYEYDENTELFNLKIININEKMELRYENNILKPNNGTVTIEKIEPGSNIKIGVYSTVENDCYNEYLRVIYISVPYFNRFYGSILCKGYEELNVCNSKFLDYQISNKNFITILNKYEFTLDNKEDIIEPVPEENKWYSSIIDFLQKYFFKILTSIISSIFSLSIFNIVYRKVKHKL